MLRRELESVAGRQPDVIALVDGKTRITYAELAERSGRMAGWLAGEAGVQRGDVVAARLPNCWEMAASFFAAAGAGAIWMPFHPQWKEREMAEITSRVPIRAMLTSRLRDRPWAGASGLSAEPIPANEIAMYVATSGTTGRPRIVPKTHANLAAAVAAAGTALGVRPGMRMLSVVPFHHAGGFNNCLLLPLLHGMTAVLLPSFTPAAVEAAVSKEQVQLLVGSPFLYRMLLESGAERGSFASVEVAISSGAPMPPELVRRCEEKLGFRVRQLYGTSETGTIAIEDAGGPIQAGVAGRPIGPVEIRIVDGEIAVRSPGLMPGYLNEPELNRTVIRDGFFFTGDLGRLDDTGTLFLCGRAKLVLNLGGIKVDPAEIENVLLEMPEVSDCAVRGVADERQGEAVAAMIAVRKGCALTRQAIVAHCRGRLAEFKIPRRIELVDRIPAEVTGKRVRSED